MAYTGNPSTNANDAIRLLIGDVSTSTGSEIFSDAEIDYFNSLKPNAHLSAAAAVISLIGSTRGQNLSSVLEKQVGDLRLKYGTESGGAGGSLQAKAKQLRLEGVRKVKPYAGGISEMDKDAAENDPDWNRSAFSVGMFDNPSYRSTST